MLTDHSPIEARFIMRRAPRGGVAPLRRDLALHDYIERQRQARLEPATDRPAHSKGTGSAVMRLARKVAGRLVAAWSGPYGLQR